MAMKRYLRGFNAEESKGMNESVMEVTSVVVLFCLKITLSFIDTSFYSGLDSNRNPIEAFKQMSTIFNWLK